MKTKELVLNETPEGDLFFQIPDDVLERLDWQEGDDIEFHEKDDGFILKKVKYANVELDLDEEMFNRVAKMAHENDITFNKQIENIMKEFIAHADAEWNDELIDPFKKMGK